jgi:two-component system, NtrC family, sensor kinase
MVASEYQLSKDVILVVDDTPTNLRVLSEALANGGFEIAVATTGESAIRQVQHNPPDLILLDVQMPGIDGFETCRYLKANPITQDIPVIFMTALSETESKVKGLSAGAVDYITKPFQQEEVLARVSVHLKLRRLSKRLEEQNILLKQFNEELEYRVAERTAELQKANLRLLQQEKLSALGQLVAGVAHEINNPVNFIYGNIDPAQSYIEDLLELVEIYQNQYPNPVLPIQQKIARVELEFLRQDLPKLLSSMRLGAERIQQIVSSLRNFSRLDEAEFKQVDLHEGLDNTLLILNYRLKEKSDRSQIQIVKNYGELPFVHCFPGQINQVFMNLLANAIDALEEYDTHRTRKEIEANPSTICITTAVSGTGWVTIHIADNGPGIPELVRNKIFDPFFTTKPIGKGTGLGLSISYQIVVETHSGKLWCESQVNQGTKFVIEIPIE